MLTDSKMLLFLLVLLKTTIAEKHICNYKLLPLTKTNLHQKSTNITQHEPRKLRITMVYMKSFTKLSYSEDFKKNIIEVSKSFWQNHLSITKSLTSPLLIDQFCDDEIKEGDYENQTVSVCSGNCSYNGLPSYLFAKCYTFDENGTVQVFEEDGVGLDLTDLGILVENDLQCEKNQLAFARPLILDIKTDRPVLGQLTVCSGNIVFSSLTFSIDVIKHELAHILAVAINLYSFFRYLNGTAQTPRDEYGNPKFGMLNINNKIYSVYKPSDTTFRMYRKIERIYTGYSVKKIAILTTPKLIEKARVFFNCSSIFGIPLEGYGEKLSGLSHFEKRIFYNSLMSPSLVEKGYGTIFDLAIMEDSGWYIPKYRLQNTTDYGKGLGCDFVMLGCYEYLKRKKLKRQSPFPFCYDNGQFLCSTDRNSFSKCVVDFAPHDLPLEFRYFNDKSVYYPDPYTDYCPMYPVIGMKKAIIESATFNCKENSTLQHLAAYDIWKGIFSVGESSRCISSMKYGGWKERQCQEVLAQPMWGAGCYTFNCSEKYRLLIEINQEQFQCLGDGQILMITTKLSSSLVTGNIICPKYNEICQGIENKNVTILKTKNINSSLVCPLHKDVSKIYFSLYLISWITVLHFMNTVLQTSTFPSHKLHRRM